MNTGTEMVDVSRRAAEEHHHMIIKDAKIESEKFQYTLSHVDTKKMNFKIKSTSTTGTSNSMDQKKNKKKKVQYPTQKLMVGNINCYFYKSF